MNVLVSPPPPHQLANLRPSGRRIAVHQTLHDLGLEDDVREALGGAVVHRPGDVAAQVLQGRLEEAVHGGRADAGSHGLGRPRPGERRRRSRQIDATEGGHLAAQVRQGVAITQQHLLLALQHLDLGVHQGSALRERDERRVLVRDPRSVRGGRRGECRQLVRQVGALLFVATRLAARLPGKELDLGKLALQALDLPVEGRGQVGGGADGLRHPGGVSPPASGSSPGAWRRPRPGSGR